MKPRLVATSGPLEGQTFAITTDSFVIGRQADCQIHLKNNDVSRRHCEIVVEHGAFLLRDLRSRHGTRVNGRPVNEVTLDHSDLVSVGTHSWLFLLHAPARRATDADDITDSRPIELGATGRESRLTRSMHLDPIRVEAALPAQARLARELHALLRLTTTLQEERALAPLARRLLDATVEALPTAEHGAVLLREPGVEKPIRIAERGTVTVSNDLVDEVLESKVAWRRPDDHGGGVLVAPLTEMHGESLGALVLTGSTGFTDRHLELLVAIAGVASLAVRNVLHLRWLEGENRRLRDEHPAHHDMIGDSAAMRRIFDLVARVARADSTFLIHGESGTGKELVAHALHRTSPRSDGPFIAINCATLSENLLESELFGHEKGAFTGAMQRKIGKMEAADRGTLFLDEVAEIPVGLQAKLLRALQERKIERVGGTRPIEIDIRVVAATHRRLEDAVEAGTFRQDLFFRLKVITCELPPLRDRREDIPLLAHHFIRRHSAKLGMPDLTISPEARRCLLAYDWPGNVRELGNVIERAVVLGDGELVRREDLPDEVVTAIGPDEGEPEEDQGYQDALLAYKKKLILDAWQESGEDYARTADRLKIHLNSLHRLVKNLGLRDALGR
ncbi:MAG: sigma 54-interacting transcriptional regulator [Acidobacteriota bacterium]